MFCFANLFLPALIARCPVHACYIFPILCPLSYLCVRNATLCGYLSSLTVLAKPVITLAVCNMRRTFLFQATELPFDLCSLLIWKGWLAQRRYLVLLFRADCRPFWCYRCCNRCTVLHPTTCIVHCDVELSHYSTHRSVYVCPCGRLCSHCQLLLYHTKTSSNQKFSHSLFLQNTTKCSANFRYI